MTEEVPTANTYSPMQAVKRHFFALRNGIIADTLRQAGSPFRYIFGLNLPQIVETANITGKNKELAEKLWANNTTRESMLLAPMLMPVEDFTIADAYRWTANIPAVEVVDILCHRLLRHLPFAAEFARELATDPLDDMRCYTAGRLAINIIYTDSDTAHAVLELLAKSGGKLTTSIARQLAERLADL